MTSGIQSKGIDLDSIFDPWQSGTTKARATGILQAGSDLNQRYAPLVYGSSATATGIKSKGADLNTLFAAFGTASYALPINGQVFTGFDRSPSGATNPASETVTFGLNADGTYSVTQSGFYTGGSVLATGTWLTTGGSASDYQVLFTMTPVTQSGAGSFSNGATTWVSVSTGRGASVTTTAPQTQGSNTQWQYSLRIQIRRASNGQVVSDTTITLNARAAGQV